MPSMEKKNYFPTEKWKSGRCLKCLKIKGMALNTVYKEISIFYIERKTICTHFKNLNLSQTPAVCLPRQTCATKPTSKIFKVSRRSEFSLWIGNISKEKKYKTNLLDKEQEENCHVLWFTFITGPYLEIRIVSNLL